MPANQRGFWTAAGVLVLSAILGGIYGPRVQATTSADDDIQQAIRKFTQVYAIIEQNYADPVNPDTAIFRGAIPGMLRTLDPHSSFFDERAFGLLREQHSGRYFGVGMLVQSREGRTVVVVPYPGSPAANAGLRPGDVIHKVNDTFTEGLTTTQVANLLKGPKGTVVRVQALREGHDQPLSFVITRDEIPQYSVTFSDEIQPGIGYIRLASFNETTNDELRDALDKLGGNNLRGLIFDMRNNPGGLLNAAVSVSDLFLSRNQLIVSQWGRAQKERPYYATSRGRRMDFPIVVLVDRFSASAAEIVAGALQDHDRALIVGETSFGKALVQTVYPMSHNTGMALTTGQYYTPSGRLIQRDYSSVSLYNYYNGSNRGENNTRQVYSTDSGRVVYGGGGINPDVEHTVAFTPFQQRLQTRNVFYIAPYPFDVGVGDFTKRYLAQNEDITRDFMVDETVLEEFRRFLTEKNFRYTETDVQENLAWIKDRIKKEIFTSVLGMDEGRRVAVQTDPQVQRAIELLPQAQSLLDSKKKDRQVAEKPR